MPIDPVCGIEMDEDLAVTFEHENKKYFFCCEGCKGIFKRKPKKYQDKV
jgi:YHS domain-containing protein